MVMVKASDADVQLPLPSGSGTFQTSVTLLPISEAESIYVALKLFLFGLNVPDPPVQLPPAALLADKGMLLAPHKITSAPAFAVAAKFRVIPTWSLEPTQGPPPSGSETVRVRITVEPISPAVGVYVAFAVFRLGEKLPTPPTQLPPATAFAERETGTAPHLTWSGPALAETELPYVIVMRSDVATHAPLPSGSGMFHVRLTTLPNSEAAGVYAAFAVVRFGLKVPKPPVQLPPVAEFAARV